MEKLSILFVLLGLSLFANAQNKEEKMMVISTTGLNFRAEPFTRAEIVGKIGYGEEVVVIEKLKETIYTLNSKYGRYSEEKSYEIPIKGYWVKATYQGEIGYLFSGYLAPTQEDSWQPKSKYLDFNQDYFLLFELGNCWYNFPESNDYYWYGFFINNDKNGDFKRINPSFYVSEDDGAIGEMSSFYVFSNELSYPIFIIGSKKELREKMNISKSNFNLFDNYEYTYDPKILNKRMVDAGIVYQKSEKYPHGETFVKSPNGKLYSMGTSRLNLSNIHEHFFDNIVFKGDIDNDEIDDYILRFGDKSSQTVLFLSTAAKEGELVAPVAVYFSGYCC